MSADLRVARVRLRRVQIPLATVYVSSMYVMPATFRTVIELETKGGVVGVGETLGTQDVFRLTEELARRWVGRDAGDRRAMQAAFARSVFDNRNGRNGWSAYGGLELASWDALGKALDLPLWSLLGGSEPTEAIELVSPIPAIVTDRPLTSTEIRAHLADLGNVPAVASWARSLADRSGFRAFKYKSAAASPRWDSAVIRALREALGDAARIRFDPNAGYPPARALELCADLDPLGLELFEDPTDDLEGLAHLKRRLRTPIATNMCVVQIDQLPAAIRSRAVDVVLADIYMWGGLERWRDLVYVARGFGLDVGVHSLFETGIGTAANLHLASTFGLTRATDSGLHLLAADITGGELGPVSDGRLGVPRGPGLGVTIDEVAMDELTVNESVVCA